MLSHVDQNNQPTMVDVSEKVISHRMARAQCTVKLPAELRAYLSGGELTLKKGPVFQTAIVAGTMAVKRTHELIPFCHPIPVESCKMSIDLNERFEAVISCEVKATHKTGVEMEALHGASIAALTVYDMCKAVSHEIVVTETKLVAKTGGKRTLLDRPTYGLVLTGGKSERMGQDKALIRYTDKPHARELFDLLKPYCDEVYLSARASQWRGTELETLPTIEDSVEGKGPIVGILSAFSKHPDANWLVVACDLPKINSTAVEMLLANHDNNVIATAFPNADKGFPEPLFALYTPSARAEFTKALNADIRCPVKVLRNSVVRLVDLTPDVCLMNVNTETELREVQN